MNTIKFEVIQAPSRSKGWARYAASQGDRRVVESNTGNEWIGGTTKEGEAEGGSMIDLRSQVQLNVGKNTSGRKETTTNTYRLIVEEGAICELRHIPGSQGQVIRVTGAREVVTKTPHATII